MTSKVRSICLGSGYAFFLLYLVGIVVVARFIPPPAPSWDAATITAYFADNRPWILIGMSICAFASALYVPWGVAIFGEMLRMEKTRYAPLSVIQVISAGLGAVFFAISPLVWLTIAFRVGHAGDSVKILNDFAWISWIVSWPFFFVQAAALGLCVLMYGTNTVPRWLGYFSIWFGLSMFPASLIVFFYEGPFAWNGVVALYLPLVMFASWYQVVTYYVGRGIKRQGGPVESAPVPERAVATPA